MASASSAMAFIDKVLLCFKTTITGFPVLWMASRFARNTLGKRLGQHVGVLASNAVFYFGLLFVGISILNDLGFQLSALLGAAGIIGIAVALEPS